jgi:hypothetical protein
VIPGGEATGTDLAPRLGVAPVETATGLAATGLAAEGLAAASLVATHPTARDRGVRGERGVRGVGDATLASTARPDAFTVHCVVQYRRSGWAMNRVHTATPKNVIFSVLPMCVRRHRLVVFCLKTLVFVEKNRACRSGALQIFTWMAAQASSMPAGQESGMESFALPQLAEDLPGAQLLKQGAEGRVYRLTYLQRPTIVKERFNKKYRHPELDAKMTKERVGWVRR